MDFKSLKNRKAPRTSQAPQNSQSSQSAKNSQNSQSPQYSQSSPSSPSSPSAKKHKPEASGTSGPGSGLPRGKRFKASWIVRIVLHVLCCMLAGAGVLILVRSIVNTAFLKGCENGSYSEMPEKILLPLRFGENYVVPYNMGNVEYQLGDYDKAINYYRQALASNPPEEDAECKIRVNLALSMCHTINFESLDRSDEEAVSNAVNTLLNARAVLTEHGCASEAEGSDEGHFTHADQLKHDIDDMLKELQTPPETEDKQDLNEGEEPDQDKNEDKSEDQDQSDDQENKNEQSQDEQARQDALKEQLTQQKKDLENGAGGSEGNGFHYIDGGKTSGYGDGTLW